MRRVTGRVHLCGWPDCRRPIPLNEWGCKTHWFSLPKELRDEIWQAYNRGRLSPEWIAANEKALEWIRGIPERTKDTHDVTPLPGEGGLNANSDSPHG